MIATLGALPLPTRGFADALSNGAAAEPTAPAAAIRATSPRNSRRVRRRSAASLRVRDALERLARPDVVPLCEPRDADRARELVEQRAPRHAGSPVSRPRRRRSG